MLGAAAAEEADRLGKTLDSQAEAEKSSYGMEDRLWDIMARCGPLTIRMTRPGSTIAPQVSDKELKLLQAKYSIFLECVTLGRKWRKEVRDALGE
ncbi:hypothetical protein JCM10296v2_006714 [Rhodotorula toruloides]